MKQILILFILLNVTFCKAQDQIIKNDKSIILCKVQSVGKLKIGYTKKDNSNNNEYEIDKVEVFMIVYKNGTIDKFENILKGQNENQKNTLSIKNTNTNIGKEKQTPTLSELPLNENKIEEIDSNLVKKQTIKFLLDKLNALCEEASNIDDLYTNDAVSIYCVGQTYTNDEAGKQKMEIVINHLEEAINNAKEIIANKKEEEIKAKKLEEELKVEENKIKQDKINKYKAFMQQGEAALQQKDYYYANYYFTNAFTNATSIEEANASKIAVEQVKNAEDIYLLSLKQEAQEKANRIEQRKLREQRTTNLINNVGGLLNTYLNAKKGTTANGTKPQGDKSGCKADDYYFHGKGCHKVKNTSNPNAAINNCSCCGNPWLQN